jgi:preprotein translocase subunit SecE
VVMTVAEATKSETSTKKMEKNEGGESSKGPESQKPSWLTWVPRKYAELTTFLSEVRTELKKVTWPGKQEVYATTIIIVATTVFFGFYLWGLDLLFSQVVTRILR